MLLVEGVPAAMRLRCLSPLVFLLLSVPGTSVHADVTGSLGLARVFRDRYGGLTPGSLCVYYKVTDYSLCPRHLWCP